MQRKLVSTAFPPGYSPRPHSAVHKQLLSSYEVIAINIRPFQQQDLEQLILLHKQWFPLDYGDCFFDKIKNKTVVCKISQAKIKQFGEVKNIMIGVLVYEYVSAGSLLKIQKWSEYFCWDFVSIYVMTLGVIDEFRNLGIGKKFIDILIKQSEQNPMVKYIHLHMVAYNSASRFYQKNGFKIVKTLYNHYNNIKGKSQNAKYYVRFFNGGVKRMGCIQWILSLGKQSHKHDLQLI